MLLPVIAHPIQTKSSRLIKLAIMKPALMLTIGLLILTLLKDNQVSYYYGQ